MPELVSLAPHVWVLPSDPDSTQVRPAIGVICTATRTLLVDAGNGDRHARELAGRVALSRWTVKDYATKPSVVHLLSYASGDRYASAECRRCVLEKPSME